jgi:hypothetical protein
MSSNTDDQRQARRDAADEEVDRLVGRVARASAELDMQIRDLASDLLQPVDAEVWTMSADERKLLGLDKGGRDFGVVLRMVERATEAAEWVHEPTRDRLRRLIPAARLAYARRSRVIHDPPLPIHLPEIEIDGPTHRAVTLPGRGQHVDVDVDKLRALGDELRALARLCLWLQSRCSAMRMERSGEAMWWPNPDPFDPFWEWFDAAYPAEGGVA